MFPKVSATYIIIGFYYLLSGVEYAVILPTLNQYLLSLNAESFFIGLVMSSFSLTGLLSAPIYGRFTDYLGSTKATVALSNCFEIGGNFMYLCARNPYMVLGSRLIAGLGSGSGSSIFGMISRSTTQQERTSVFSRLMAVRQIGLVIGPAFNLFLRNLDFHIGPLHVTALNVPGLFMALLWAIHTILLLIFYREFEVLRTGTQNEVADDVFEREKPDDNDPLAGRETTYRSRAPSAFFTYVYHDLLREEVVVCLSVTFTVMFVQTGIETLVTPMTLQLFRWDELPNSIFYCLAGVLIILSFFVLSILSRKVSDRILLVAGLFVLFGLDILFLVFIIYAVKVPVGTPWVFALFCLHSVILVIDLPFVWVPQASLFSKITSARTQGFNQGVRLLVMGMGQILGPLWAASLLGRLYIMASVNLVVVSLVLVMVLASYERLNVSDPTPRSQDNEDSVSERTSLLRSGPGSNAVNS